MTDANRRPIKSRNAATIQAFAASLAKRGVRPNTISQLSMGAAALGGAALAATAWTGFGLDLILFGLALIAIQARLFCNLIDGMVAVEGGLKESDGPFWNEAPDRISDLCLFAGAGVAAGLPWLGLLVAALAIGTAYLRELGRAEGLPPDFSGPLAKPHRMAVLTLGVLAALVLPWDQPILTITLALLALGTALTCGLRAGRLITALKQRP